MGAAGDYAANLAGKHFDAYHLLRKIGRGGMSVVYLAEPADGAYQQNVAVKLMLSATATDAAKRVGRERQTLAALNHPNIARLIDGGASNDGIPYLEMDYVDGERIDDWCHARMYMRLGRDLANYQVTQMGEAHWAYFTTVQKDKPAAARQSAQALLRHAEKHPTIFANAPAADWVAAARMLVGK